MTAPNTLTRHFVFIAIATLVIGCDDVDTASTSPVPSHLVEPRTAHARQEVAVRADKIVGGGGISLTMYESGSPGARPIVFIHGFSQNFMTWDAQLSGLSELFNVVTYDLRGHGASDKPPVAGQYTESSLWADDLAAVIKARNLQRPVLVGWSYGGYVIADYMRKFGDAGLGGLVFLAAVTKNGTQEAQDFLTNEVLAIFGDVLSDDARRSIDASRALTSMFARDGSEQWEIAFGSAMMVPPQIRLAMFSRVLDNDDVLRNIRVPTLVVHSRADRIVKLSAAEHIAATVPGATLLVYTEGGHAPHLEIANRFNRDLAEFVRSIP